MRMIAATVLALLAMSTASEVRAQALTAPGATTAPDSSTSQGFLKSQPAPMQLNVGNPSQLQPIVPGVVVDAPVATPSSNRAYQNFQGQPATGRDLSLTPPLGNGP